jgi:hypothetical protein
VKIKAKSKKWQKIGEATCWVLYYWTLPKWGGLKPQLVYCRSYYSGWCCIQEGCDSQGLVVNFKAAFTLEAPLLAYPEAAAEAWPVHWPWPLAQSSESPQSSSDHGAWSSPEGADLTTIAPQPELLAACLTLILPTTNSYVCLPPRHCGRISLASLIVLIPCFQVPRVAQPQIIDSLIKWGLAKELGDNGRRKIDFFSTPHRPTRHPPPPLNLRLVWTVGLSCVKDWQSVITRASWLTLWLWLCLSLPHPREPRVELWAVSWFSLQ